MRGEIVRLTAPRGGRGQEQRGQRFAVILQSDDLPLATLIVAPTSTSARSASFRPEITVNGTDTRVLLEQMAAVDPARLGEGVGYLSVDELAGVDRAIKVVLDVSETQPPSGSVDVVRFQRR